ncbi:hypothetical protein KY284_001167 [Solanum tuberosum]|nr:hypothetical protein KY284_001167 [Solanum tuberosum]
MRGDKRVEEEEETSEEEVVDIPAPEPGKEEEPGERPLYILIDPGSSHNFMDEELARELQGNIQDVRIHAINVADGHDKQTKELCKAFS